jgi:HK97 family phage major capsid protein
LVDDSLQGYQDLLRGSSIAAQLWAVAGMNINFEGFSAIKIPARGGTKVDLASGFTGESQAIPVRRATFTSQTLNPYKWGAITVTSKELVQRSMPSIIAILQQGLVDDTATKLDTDFFDSTAVAAGYRPAGIFNGVTGTAAATGGATPADDILTDIRNLVTPIYAANMGTTMRIVMHPTNGLAMATVVANGEYLFRNELSGGSLFGIPVIQSTNASLTELWCFDMAEIAVASSAPEITVSDSATIVMVNDDAVAPFMSAATPRSPNTGQVLGTGGAQGTTPVSPTRSLFQTEDVAIKTVQYISWKTLRAGCLNKITGISYP